MTPMPIRWKLLLCIGFLVLSSSTLRAQDTPTVKWRTDYNAARKEAEAKNLPVLIDFVRPNCPPCAKMEQYTFTDARILRTLNEKFIPLKINGLEDVQLASRLNISLYPTLVLAGPDGRITQTLIGYQDADALHDHLQRLLASITPTDAAQKDYQNALKWEASGDNARAILALKSILEDNKPGLFISLAEYAVGEKYVAASVQHLAKWDFRAHCPLTPMRISNWQDARKWKELAAR